MKKVIFLFCLFFLIKVNAKEYIDYSYLDVYVNGFKDNTYISYQAVYKEHEGIPLYCLDFGVSISRENGYSLYDFNENGNYTANQKQYIEIISFFGYRYGNHNDIYYYLAAQELIWGSLGVDVYWTYTRFGGDYIDLSEYKREILDLYSEYINENVLYEESHTAEIGNTYTIYDQSSKLPQYEYTYSGINDVSQTPREFIIHATFSNVDVLTLNRNYSKGYNSLLFLEPGYQTIIKPGSLQSKRRVINLVITNTSIKINRINKSNKSNNYIKLDYAFYEIFDEYGNFYRRVSTNSLGELIITNIPLGKYTIIEVLPSYGFNHYDEIINVDLVWGLNPVEDTIYIEPIEKELTITNIYKINNVEYLDSGIKFEVYKDDALEMVLETDENGFVSGKLQYGIYKVKQINSREGFEVEPEFEIEVNEINNDLNYIFINEKEEVIEENISSDEPIEEDVQEENDENNLINESDDVSLIDDSFYEINYEETNSVTIDELPQLYEKGNIKDLLCEFLLYVLFQLLF